MTKSHREIEAQARAEHLRIVYGHSVIILLGNLAASSTLLIGLWGKVSTTLLAWWCAIMLAFSAVRWILGRRFPGGQMDERALDTWEARYVAGVLVSGLLWGIAGGAFYLPNQPAQGFFLALLIVGMCAAAGTSLSYYRFAYPLFVVPAISPLALNMMLDDGVPAKVVGYVIPFYFTLLCLLSRQVYRTACESILARISSQHEAMLDHLTGTANRRAFDEILTREWYRAIRSQRPVALVIADIDNFKRYNDTFGHGAGDGVLKAVAAMFEGRVRRGADVVARIGGEEFAVILPDTDLTGARTLAESIRLGAHKLFDGNQAGWPSLSISFGVSSCVPTGSCSSVNLFEKADVALYNAKRKGKDRVETLALA